MGKIHAVSTQGAILGIVLAALAGFGIGQYVKTGKRLGVTGGTLKS